MDEHEVTLKITIKHNGKEYLDKSSEFISFEELKNTCKQKFNISNAIIKDMKFKIKDQNIFIQNDADLISNMEEIDEYNYALNLDISLNEVKIKEEKLKLFAFFDKKRRNDKLKNFLFYCKIIDEYIKLEKIYKKKKLEIEDKIIYYQKNMKFPSNNKLLKIENCFHYSYQGNKQNNKLTDDKLLVNLEKKIQLNDKKYYSIKIDNKYMEKFNNELQKNFLDLKSEIKNFLAKKQEVYENHKLDDYAKNYKIILQKLQEVKKIKVNQQIKLDQNIIMENKKEKENLDDTPLRSKNFKGFNKK